MSQAEILNTARKDGIMNHFTVTFTITTTNDSGETKQILMIKT